MVKVQLPTVERETRAKLNKFKTDYNYEHPERENQLKTIGDAIDYAIIQAEKVPELEKKIKELLEEVDTLNAATTDLSFQQMKGD